MTIDDQPNQSKLLFWMASDLDATVHRAFVTPLKEMAGSSAPMTVEALAAKITEARIRHIVSLVTPPVSSPDVAPVDQDRREAA